ncbi:DUF1963 domain-containing protein [Flavobacterium sp. FlaQc-30]|uniref:DUF1963 domain-containing protein n=1 Tax=Flavobacterium sp. FlaQc-30 TaxID=3374179 RepID=UPI0037583046
MNNQEFKTSTFSLSIPDVYSDVQIAWESIRAAHEVLDDDYLSFATTGLVPIVSFDKFLHKELIFRYWKSCLSEENIKEIIAEKIIQIENHNSNVRLVRTNDNIFYYLGIVQISDEFCYTFKADCKIEHRDFYEPLFEQIWMSLKYFGDPQEAIDKLPSFLRGFYYNEQATEIVADQSVLQKQQVDISKEIEAFCIPQDEKEHWIIDDVVFDFSSECNVNSNDKLYVALEGLVRDYDKERHGHVVNSYNGGAHFNFSFSKVYDAGIPTGVIQFELSRDKTYNHYLWESGFTFSLRFTGNVTLKDGWIGLNGYLEDECGEQKKCYKISLAKRIPLQELEWEKYEFTTFKELEGAIPKAVRHLKLTNPAYVEFRESIDSFTDLETLIVQFTNDSQEVFEFVEIPSFIKHFKNLKKLYFSGISAITKLPIWIGDLRELEFFLFTDSKVEGINPNTFQYLKKLKFCYLQYNKLVSAPAFPLDGSIEIIHLEGNQLNKVPASYLKLENLTRLNIKNNPITWLPLGLENIPELELELEKKTTLLDYSYKGADGKGVVPYNDEIFYARNDIVLRNLLAHAIEKVGFKKYEEGINKLARHSVSFVTTVFDDYDEIGNNRFGGLPDLPESVGFPKIITETQEETNYVWQFIAQINCASVAHLQEYLPRTGILYFFIEDQQDFKPKVIYFDGEISQLKSAREFDNTEKLEYFEFDIFQPFKAIAEKAVSTPVFYYDEHYYEKIAPELEELTRKHNETELFKKKLLPFNEEPIHGINSYVFKQHDSPEIEAVDKLKGKTDEWMVLLKVSTDNKPEFCFWDAGEIYFVIHKSDLAKRDFSNVYCGLESS